MAQTRAHQGRIVGAHRSSRERYAATAIHQRVEVGSGTGPAQRRIVHERIPRGHATLFSGEGSAGKSTIQLQLSFAIVLGREWLATVRRPGPAIFIDAEDDEEELHRRGDAVLSYYRTTWSAATKAGLHLMSFAGQVLAAVNRTGRIEPSPIYERLLEAASDIKPRMISIASAANVFAGNENDRSQVQQFISLLTRMAIVAGGAVQLISHPSLTGINTDTGLSGNTQWHNAVRARSYLRGVKPVRGVASLDQAAQESKADDYSNS